MKAAGLRTQIAQDNVSNRYAINLFGKQNANELATAERLCVAFISHFHQIITSVGGQQEIQQVDDDVDDQNEI